MRTSSRKVYCSLCLLAILSGCASPALIGKSELNLIRKADFQTLDGSMQYISDLSSNYIKYSDYNSITGDVITLGLIGAAGTAAGGLLFETSTNVLKAAGLAAGALGSMNSYFKPAQASEALLRGAEQLICIERAGGRMQIKFKTVTITEEKSDDFKDLETAAANTLLVGVDSVRVGLRRALRRTTPTYADLLRAFRENEGNAVSGSESLAEIEEALINLESEVGECLESN